MDDNFFSAPDDSARFDNSRSAHSLCSEVLCEQGTGATVPFFGNPLAYQESCWQAVVLGEQLQSIWDCAPLATTSGGEAHLSDSILPEGKQSGSGGRLDYFGCEVVHNGGIATLESLLSVDKATLATFIQWNRINIADIGRLMSIKRSAAYCLVIIAAIGSVHEAHIFDSPIFNNSTILSVLNATLRVLITLLWDHKWLLLFSIAVAAIMELTVFQPRRSKLVEFGQMLDVAFAYTSKAPIADIDETPDRPLVEKRG